MKLEPPPLVGKSRHLIGLGRHCWVYLFTSIEVVGRPWVCRSIYGTVSISFFWLDLNGRFCLASASRTVFVIIEALVLLTDVKLTRIYVELLRNTLQINVIQTVFISFQSFLFTGTPFIFQTNWWVYFYENQIKIMWLGLKKEKDLVIMLVIHKTLTIQYYVLDMIFSLNQVL